MSLLTRIFGRVADPRGLLRQRQRDALRRPPCTPEPPRDPPAVRPPGGGCSTGPEPWIGGRTQPR
jgi:hypothetical protein